MKKIYGESRVDICPFCDRQATTKNQQGVPVCMKHKESYLENIRCFCGDYLDVMEGKYGPYFHCMNCGNISWKKGMQRVK